MLLGAPTPLPFSWSAGLALGASVVGVTIAALVVARWLLPTFEKSKVRAPSLLLLGHLALFGASMGASAWPGVETSMRTAAILLLLIAVVRTAFVLVVDAILQRRPGRHVPKIFRDIGEGLAYGAVVLVTLRQAGAQLDALLTTSALLTAVVGLSLQDTLGNLFAGLSLQAQSPFEVGDWIRYRQDEETLGRVIEINWRATKVLTLDAVEVVIPNGQLARASIHNYTRPSPVSRRGIELVLPFSESPHRVQSVLIDALRHVEGVLGQPSPMVLTSTFEERGIRYWVRYFTDDFGRREITDALVRDRIWFALSREGIPFAVPTGSLRLQEDDEAAREKHRAEAFGRRLAALRRVDFLRVLGDEQIDVLARSAVERVYAHGEWILREGESGDELFIVLAGEVAVLVGRDKTEVARLESGAIFGEMSVMTGEPRRASVRAERDTQVLVVGKDAVKTLLNMSPELAEGISDVLASRREELNSASTQPRGRAVVDSEVAQRNELLRRIKQFFSL